MKIGNRRFFHFFKGAEELDKELVSKVLLWLEEYQKSYKVFLKVIKSYFKLTDENASVVAD